jgi:hypothetical protein
MTKTLMLAVVAALLGGGIYFSVRNHPSADSAASLVKATPVVASICVQPIQNLSHKAVVMDGIDDELVAQLSKAGFKSRKLSDAGGQCDAVTNAELVDISGRSRKTARIDFRLTLTGDQVPRMSSSVEGKSGTPAKSMSDFVINPDTKETAGAEREAIVAALHNTATQIDAANKRGLPPWQAKEQ